MQNTGIRLVLLISNHTDQMRLRATTPYKTLYTGTDHKLLYQISQTLILTSVLHQQGSLTRVEPALF